MQTTHRKAATVVRLEDLKPGESAWVSYGVGARSDGTVVLYPTLHVMEPGRGFFVNVEQDAAGNRVYDVTMSRAQVRSLHRLDGIGTVAVRDVYVWKVFGTLTGKRELYRGAERGGLN